MVRTIKKKRYYKHKGGDRLGHMRSAIKSLKKLGKHISSAVKKIKNKSVIKVTLAYMTYLSTHNPQLHKLIIEKAKMLQSKFKANDTQSKQEIKKMMTTVNKKSVETLKEHIEHNTENEIRKNNAEKGKIPSKKEIKDVMKNLNEKVSKLLDKDGNIIEREAIKLGVTYYSIDSKGTKKKTTFFGGDDESTEELIFYIILALIVLPIIIAAAAGYAGYSTGKAAYSAF